MGDDALLVELAGADAACSLALWARAHLSAREVVPGARSVLLDGLADRAGAAARLVALRDGPTRPDRPDLRQVEDPGTAEDLVELPTVYDGADLDDVAGRWGCTVAEVVERHTATEFRVAFCGFAPGFAYLSGLPAAWAVGRHADPRTRVPAGAVALADTWCGVYPTASPGGWRLLGRTDAPLWDVTRPRPALLAPGTRVRFVVAR